MVQVPYDHLKRIKGNYESSGEATIDYEYAALQNAYLFTEKFPLLLVDLIVQVSSCNDRRGFKLNLVAFQIQTLARFFFSPTVAILQLNEEGVFIHEVIKVGDDVVVLQHGQDAYFIRDISPFLLRERI